MERSMELGNEEERSVLAPLLLSDVPTEPAPETPLHEYAELVHLVTIADAATAYVRQAKGDAVLLMSSPPSRLLRRLWPCNCPPMSSG